MGTYHQPNNESIFDEIVNNKVKTRSLIDGYVNFYTEGHISNKWKVILKSLLSKFEHYVLQEDNDVKKNILIKVLLKNCFYYPVPDIEEVNANAIIFWPFQFLHCDFMEPVISALKQNNHSYQVFVFRDDLLIHLQKKNIQATLIKFVYKRYSLKKICLNVIDAIHLLLSIRRTNNTLITQNIILNTLRFTGIVENALAAVKEVVKANAKQYHVIGYDLSIVGRALLHELNTLIIPNGRIQNGAPNYLLAGYSEVQDIFLWDDISQKTYSNLGFKGNTWIVGNVLLDEKLKDCSREALLSVLKGESYKGRVLIALSGPGHNTSVAGHQATIKLLGKLIHQNPGFQFLLKMHPKDQKHYYREIEKEQNVLFVDELFHDSLPNAIEFLNISDYLITGASSVALDAFALKVKVIALDPLYELTHFDFIYKNEDVLLVNKEEDLIKLKDLNTRINHRDKWNEKKSVEMIVNHILKRLENN